MKRVRFDELNAVLWKNGLGTTREIAVFPAGASMDDFVWRVSIADVDTASPFSVFPGIDRTILLLDGDGFTMTLDDAHAHALTTPLEPFAFAGEARVDVALAGGPTRDFNLMVRRGHANASIDVIRGPAVLDVTAPGPGVANVALIHVAKGHVVVDDVPCGQGDTAMMPGRAVVSEGAVALVVRAREDDR